MPFGIPDIPVPADFEIEPIATPKKKGKGNLPHFGRLPGHINKLSRDLKQGILNGAIAHGSDGAGEGGLDGYLAMCAARYPKHYLTLLGKLVPLQVNGEVGRHVSTVNVISIPHGKFLTREEIENAGVTPLSRIEHMPDDEAPVAALEHLPEPAPAPAPAEPEPRSPEEEQQLIDQLTIEIRELAQRAGVSLVP